MPDDNPLLSLFMAKLDNLPTTRDTQNLRDAIDELKKVVVPRAEHDVKDAKVEARFRGIEDDVGSLKVTTEEYKRARLPSWMAWVIPAFVAASIGIVGVIWNHPQSPQSLGNTSTTSPSQTTTQKVVP